MGKVIFKEIFIYLYIMVKKKTKFYGRYTEERVKNPNLTKNNYQNRMEERQQKKKK